MMTACWNCAGSQPVLGPTKPDPGDRRNLAEARADLAGWLTKWQGKYPKLTDWAEETIEETFSFYRLPRRHHKHLKSSNMLERFNEEIRRRTYVVRAAGLPCAPGTGRSSLPNAPSGFRLVRALAVETNENWLEANRYLNMDDLREQKKFELRQAA